MAFGPSMFLRTGRFSGIRFFSQVASNASRKKLPLSKGIVLTGAVTGLCAGAYYAYDPFTVEYYFAGAVRSIRTGTTAARIIADYYFTLNYSQGDDEAKAKCHERSARKMLDMCKANGGIYIKLGQHIAALTYLLPQQYTETMKVLQDRCPPTSLSDIEKLFIQDTGKSLNELFSEFDPEPLGVASLAQVHRGVLAEDGRPVAIKIQHPYLDLHTPADIKLCSKIVRLIKRIFPDFEFEWLSKEMEESLPCELNFVHEAMNAQKAAYNFRNAHTLKIPDVYYSQRRILLMEYIKGGRIDDLNYMKTHDIDPNLVSLELSRIYSEMIFLHGFVHCDPHPGNIFVRPKRRKYPWFLRWFVGEKNPNNFEIVLLDHGLYRQLDKGLRIDYAKLWIALLLADEKGIERQSFQLFEYNKSSLPNRRKTKDGLDYHRLFASMITGRSWDVISNVDMATNRSQSELTIIQNKVSSTEFLLAISEILAALPREVLLLLKTNDLLRSVDESLGRGALMSLQSLTVMGWYCAAAVRDEALEQFKLSAGTKTENERSISRWSPWQALWAGLVQYVRFGIQMVVLDVYILFRSFST